MPSLASIFYGDINLSPNPNPADGVGNLFVANMAQISGNIPSTSITSGAVQIPNGGLGVGGDVYIGATLNVTGNSNLKQTSINTTGNALKIIGSGTSSGIDSTTDGGIKFASTTAGLSLTAAATSLITTSAGDMSILANLGSAVLGSGASSSTAVQVSATNANGGVSISAGTGGVGIIGTGSSSFALNSDADANILIRRYGSTTTPNNKSLINIANERGTLDSAVKLEATLGGITNTAATTWTTTVTGGAFSLTGNNATSTVGLKSTGNSQNLNIQLLGATNSSLAISSETTSDSAIALSASAGGISQTAVTKLKGSVSAGPIDFAAILASGSAGSSIYSTSVLGSQDFNIGLKVVTPTNARLILSSQGNGNDANLLSSPNGGTTINVSSGFYATATAGPFSLTGSGGTTGPVLQYTSVANDIDYTIQLLGAQRSRLRLLSAGTTAQAVDIEASAGGIYQSAAGPMSLQTTDTTNGIQLGTLYPNVPISIGNGTNSTTTIGNNLVVTGNFIVNGTQTTINAESLSTTDNIILIHSAPLGTANAGIVTKRYQTTAGGDVVLDTPNETGTLQAGSANSITLPSSSSTVANYYTGFWIKVTYASNSTSAFAQINTYNATTKVATLVSGQTFSTVPASGDTYALFGHNFVATYFNEFMDTYDVAFTNSDPTRNNTLNVTGRPNVILGNLTLDRTLQTDTIVRNTTSAVAVEGVSFSSGAITGATSINGNKIDITANYNLADATGQANGVLISAITTPGPYQIRVNDTAAGGANAIFLCSKAIAGVAGMCDRMVSSSGSNNQRIELIWNANEAPRLYYSVRPGDSSTRTYTVRISTV